MEAENRLLRLDVGCGNRPSGDVNTDLYPVDFFHHRTLREANVMNVGEIPNFVKCDACALPFTDGCFEEVFSGQVIEHVQNPFVMLRELCRVSHKKVIVETVHCFGENLTLNPFKRLWLRSHHINKFNFRSFEKVSFALGYRVKRPYVVSYYEFPHRFCCLLRFPFEIGVELIKYD